MFPPIIDCCINHGVIWYAKTLAQMAFHKGRTIWTAYTQRKLFLDAWISKVVYQQEMFFGPN